MAIGVSGRPAYAVPEPFTRAQRPRTLAIWIDAIRTAFAVIRSPVLLLPMSLSDIVVADGSAFGTRHLVFMSCDVKPALTKGARQAFGALFGGNLQLASGELLSS